MGLAVLALFWLVETVKSFRLDFSLVSLISVGITLLNPFGIGIYQEALNHFSSPLLQTVYEWQPVDFASLTGKVLLIFAAVVMLSLFLGKKERDIAQIVILASLLFLGFSKRRFVPLFVLASLPVLVQLIRKVTKLLKSEWIEPLTYIVVIAAFLYASFIRLPKLKLSPFSWNDYCLSSPSPIGCSEKAVEFLKQNPPQGKMFNLYQWGGYLIYRLPEKKVFIDGRMHLWQKGDQKIIGDYGQIFEARPGWEEKLEEYNVSWIFVPGLSPLHKAVWYHPQWQQIYNDPFSVIFIKLTSPKISLLNL